MKAVLMSVYGCDNTSLGGEPNARAMATGSDHRGVVGYNLQAAVDTKHHIVVANAVTNRGHDRSNLLEMAKAAQAQAAVSPPDSSARPRRDSWCPLALETT